MEINGRRYKLEKAVIWPIVLYLKAFLPFHTFYREQVELLAIQFDTFCIVITKKGHH